MVKEKFTRLATPSTCSKKSSVKLFASNGRKHSIAAAYVCNM